MSCPGFVKLKLPRHIATERLRGWLGRREILAPAPVELAEITAAATDGQGRWRGLAIFIREHDGWTIFEDLSGGLCALGHQDASCWITLAAGADLIEAEYNDALPFATMAVAERGGLMFDFFDDPSAPELHRNRGTPPSSRAGVRTWVDIASLIDGDAAWVNSPGLLWILEA